jgi:hypothetical protein
MESEVPNQSRKKSKRSSRVRAARTDLLESRTPEVALKRSRSARWRIQCGLRALRRIQTHDAAIKALERGWPANVDQFRKWKHVGTGALYTTHKELLPDIQQGTKRLDTLSQKQPTSGPNKIRDELAKAHAEIAALKQMLMAMAGDVLQMGRDWETERADKLHYMHKIAETKGLGGLERAQQVPNETLIPPQLAGRIANIEEHRMLRTAKAREDKLRRNRLGDG